jgi:hypothetical protein
MTRESGSEPEFGIWIVRDADGEWEEEYIRPTEPAITTEELHELLDRDPRNGVMIVKELGGGTRETRYVGPEEDEFIPEELAEMFRRGRDAEVS